MKLKGFGVKVYKAIYFLSFLYIYDALIGVPDA